MFTGLVTGVTGKTPPGPLAISTTPLLQYSVVLVRLGTPWYTFWYTFWYTLKVQKNSMFIGLGTGGTPWDPLGIPTPSVIAK